MRRSLLLLTLLLTCAGCDEDGASAQKQAPPDPKAVQADVRALHNALHSEELDVDAILDLTHPRVIEGLGGREKARATLEQSLTVVRSSGLEVEAFEFPSDPVFVSSPDHEFAIVPTRTIFESRGRRVESGNFQFGARRKGETQWKYVEGSRLTPEALAQLFPEFPPHTRLPETYRRVIEE